MFGVFGSGGEVIKSCHHLGMPSQDTLDLLPCSSTVFSRSLKVYQRNGLGFRSCPAHLHSGLGHPCLSPSFMAQVNKESGSLGQRPWMLQEPVASGTGSHVWVYITVVWPVCARPPPCSSDPPLVQGWTLSCVKWSRYSPSKGKVIQSPSCWIRGEGQEKAGNICMQPFDILHQNILT